MAINADHAGVHYYTDLDLSHETFEGYTSLNGTAVDGRTDLSCATIDGNANLQNLRSRDGVNAWSLDVSGNVDVSGGHLGDLFLRNATTESAFSGDDLQVDGDIDLKRFSGAHIRLPDADIDGTLYLDDTDTAYLDLRGATVQRLWIDDLDRYDIRTDADTWIGEAQEGYGVVDDPALTTNEQDFVDKIYDRPRFPPEDRDGVLFSHDDLKKDLVLDAERYGLIGSLQQKDVIQAVNDNRYLLVTGQYDWMEQAL